MEKQRKLLTALGLLLAGFFVAAAAGAQNVDDKIKALEQELSALKSQQMELKKEATAAAAALPSFSYRPGNGVDITAADKSWGLRFGMEAHLRTLFESGQDAVGRTNGEVMLRRWRPVFSTASTTVCMRSRWPGIWMALGPAMPRTRPTPPPVPSCSVGLPTFTSRT